MDIFKFICSEICFFIKSSIDISVQKIGQILHRNKTGL